MKKLIEVMNQEGDQKEWSFQTMIGRNTGDKIGKELSLSKFVLWTNQIIYRTK